MDRLTTWANLGSVEVYAACGINGSNMAGAAHRGGALPLLVRARMARKKGSDREPVGCIGAGLVVLHVSALSTLMHV